MTTIQERLQDGKYKVYKVSRLFWPYVVVDPLGIVLDISWTLRSAQRIIKRDRHRMTQPTSRLHEFYLHPRVHEEDK